MSGLRGKMPTFVVHPRQGVGPVRFGMSRAEVHRVMPPERWAFRKVPAAAHDTDAWYRNGFQVFYAGREPTVEFIELSAHSGCDVKYEGLDGFATAADELVRAIAATAAFDPAAPELGHAYLFPSLDLALWRPTLDQQFFSTIGAGVRGYYSVGFGEAR
jgi:hypothetical protein